MMTSRSGCWEEARVNEMMMLHMDDEIHFLFPKRALPLADGSGQCKKRQGPSSERHIRAQAMARLTAKVRVNRLTTYLTAPLEYTQCSRILPTSLLLISLPLFRSHIPLRLQCPSHDCCPLMASRRQRHTAHGSLPVSRGSGSCGARETVQQDSSEALGTFPACFELHQCSSKPE